MLAYTAAFFGLLASTVYADGAAILKSLDKISASTNKLNDAVVAFKGDLPGALPIAADSIALLENIHSGTKTAKASHSLTFDETIKVAGATFGLQSTVNMTLANIEDAKPKFDKLLLSPVILGNLKLDKSTTDEFSMAVTEKVPENLQATAMQLTAGFDAAFDEAIATYKLF
ncbi:hypothetical protein KC332_g3649 [Hortaea werneckii]|uniref:Antigenic cell wall galactomannoprotein n=2 Tax=Hortaea werneckii TaxID=91943 RepID=A0A3M7GM73_HORWE|nr:hypothetical protein KC350_g10091 [Hortaea werneckii]OTA34685.1 hypothetical protein BTJ68_05313 [Hortaea werneckii EXF-2000]KAI6840457.1 hypothetical protein KC358_g4445 [Hortaea werneckii]KAI6939538.1 hypothetical protein KC341_g4092 [Hortaea werneckii]KAI6947242.1 hypothetical protein KC348_g2653 [Hortaea werneckii]